MQKQAAEMEAVRRSELLCAQNEAERVIKECRIAQEEKRMMQQKLQELQREHDEVRSGGQQRREKDDETERELKKLQEKYREAIAQLHAL